MFVLVGACLAFPGRSLCQDFDWGLLDTPVVKPLAFLAVSDGSILMSDTGRIFRSTDQGSTWQSIEGPYEFSQIVEGPGGVLFARRFYQLYDSFDGGATWTFLTEANFFVGNVAVGPDTSLYFGTLTKTFCNLFAGCMTSGGGLHASYDGGMTWNQIGFGDVAVSNFAVTRDRIFVVRGNSLFDSGDGGQTWDATSSDQDYYVGSVTADLEDRAFVATGSGVVTYDRATQSLQLLGDLREPVFRINVTSSGSLFARGQNATYRSSDNGLNWQPIVGPDVCRTPSAFCTYDETIDGYILVGTELGLYRSSNPVSITDAELPSNLSPKSAITVYPNPVGDLAKISFDLSTTQYVELDLFDVQGRGVMKLDLGFAPRGKQLVTIQTAGLPAGIYLCQLISGESIKPAILHVVH